MKIDTLKAEKRDSKGTSAARKLRGSGLTPCVVYGHGEDTVNLVIPTLELEAALRHGDRIVQISIGDATPAHALVKEVQYEVLTEKILHVDFTYVRMDEKMEVDVPVVLRGEAEGLKAGGMVERILHNITVSCLPNNIPEEILIDINELKVGDSWRVERLVAPPNVDFVTPGDALIVACHMPRGEEEEAEIPEEAVEPTRVGEEETGEEGDTTSETSSDE
ncbi:MAG: 50S ribosomal protein L25 [Planctomycetes bacterium]|nr:50S ribosomal protein L25 [Planctomycetota bacterium]